MKTYSTLPYYFSSWLNTCIPYVQIGKQIVTHACALSIYFFIADMTQFFVLSTPLIHTSFAWYSALLPHASLKVIGFAAWWIGISSLYSHSLIGLHLITIIPLSIAVLSLKKFLYPTPLTPLITALLLLIIDSAFLWSLGFSTNPFKNFTNTHIIATLLSTWLFSLRTMSTGE